MSQAQQKDKNHLKGMIGGYQEKDAVGLVVGLPIAFKCFLNDSFILNCAIIFVQIYIHRVPYSLY